MNRLLITGATGFIGGPCVERARRGGFEVHAVARSVREPLGVKVHRTDLFDTEAVSRLLAAIRPTHLLHLAWIATPSTYWMSPENHTWVAASQQLLRSFAREGGRRAVIAGTCAEYDWSIAGICRERGTPILSHTTYGQCKNQLREWAEEFGQTNGIGIAWGRLFFIYGPREHPARLIPSVARALFAGEAAECTSGAQERDFLHVSDAVEALVSLVESDITGPVNIGSGEPRPVRDVIEQVASACGRPDLVRLGVRPLSPTEPPVLAADVSRLWNELGWRPRMTLEDGLISTVDWWRYRQAA